MLSIVLTVCVLFFTVEAQSSVSSSISVTLSMTPSISISACPGNPSCQLGEYESSPCTALTNRTCSTCTACVFNVSYVSQACHDNQDSECTNCHGCPSGYGPIGGCDGLVDTNCSIAFCSRPGTAGYDGCDTSGGPQDINYCSLTLSCAAGFDGTPSVDCTGGFFAFSGCSRKF